MSRRGSFRVAARPALALAMAVVATGCVIASVTPSAPASESASGSSSPATSPLAASTAPASTAAPTPSPTIGTAPSGDWKSLSWVRVDGRLAAGYPSIVPSVTEVVDGQQMDLEGPNVELRATYGGYLQLLWDPHKRTLIPWLSADAQSWRRGELFDLTAWKADFVEWDKLAPDQSSRDACGLWVDDYAASPSGIVLRARFACSYSCGGDYTSVDAMWASADGLTWMPVDAARTFGKYDVDRIYGGGNGLIGLTPDRKAGWTSTDGRTWRKGTVPGDAFEIADPVSIDSGFVIGGTIRVKSARQIEPGDKCGISEPTAGGQFRAVAWLSSDGVTWQRNVITSTLFANATVEVTRVDDRTLIATVTSVTADADGYEDSETTTNWLSRDGRSWTQLAAPADWMPFTIEGGGGGLISNGGHFVVGRDGALHLLTEAAAAGEAAAGGVGDMPPDNVTEVVGPVGVLATDGKTFWLAIPSAG